MTMIPLTIILTAAVVLGGYLGILYLRRDRRPMLIATHFILGMLALIQMVMLFRGTPSGQSVSAGSYGKVSALLFGIAILFGVGAALFRQSRVGANVALATHATVASAAFLVYLVWISQL